jgi:hypothetical protein
MCLISVIASIGMLDLSSTFTLTPNVKWALVFIIQSISRQICNLYNFIYWWSLNSIQISWLVSLEKFWVLSFCHNSEPCWFLTYMLRHMFSARRAHPQSVFSETVMPVRKKSVKSSSSPGTAVQHVSLPPLLIMFTNDIIIILPEHLLKPESTCQGCFCC